MLRLCILRVVGPFSVDAWPQVWLPSEAKPLNPLQRFTQISTNANKERINHSHMVVLVQYTMTHEWPALKGLHWVLLNLNHLEMQLFSELQHTWSMPLGHWTVRIPLDNPTTLNSWKIQASRRSWGSYPEDANGRPYHIVMIDYDYDEDMSYARIPSFISFLLNALQLCTALKGVT